jgi:hypothetical protein
MDDDSQIYHLEQRVEKLEQQIRCSHRWVYDANAAGTEPWYVCTRCALRSPTTTFTHGMVPTGTGRNPW